MEKILIKYKQLKSLLTPNLGTEDSNIEVGWNDSVLEEMENILKKVPNDIANKIRLNHL